MMTRLWMLSIHNKTRCNINKLKNVTSQTKNEHIPQFAGSTENKRHIFRRRKYTALDNAKGAENNRDKQVHLHNLPRNKGQFSIHNFIHILINHCGKRENWTMEHRRGKKKRQTYMFWRCNKKGLVFCAVAALRCVMSYGHIHIFLAPRDRFLIGPVAKTRALVLKRNSNFYCFLCPDVFARDGFYST